MSRRCNVITVKGGLCGVSAVLSVGAGVLCRYHRHWLKRGASLAVRQGGHIKVVRPRKG